MHIHIFIDLGSQIAIFFVTYHKYSKPFPNLSQKSKYLKNDNLFVREVNIMLMTSSKQEKHLLF